MLFIAKKLFIKNIAPRIFSNLLEDIPWTDVFPYFFSLVSIGKLSFLFIKTILKDD